MKRTSAGFVLLMAALPAAVLPAAGQDATHHLDGYVVNAMDGAPVTSAYVVSRAGPNQVILGTSESDGHIRADLGYPSFLVRHAGFLDWQGSLGPDESVPLRIQLIPQAVVTGTLTDQDGFPIWRAFLSLIRVGLVGTPQEHGVSVLSNDRGEFRIAGLSNGRYYLRMEPSSAPFLDARYTPQFYAGDDAGGTIEPSDVGVIEIAAGQTRAVHFRAAMQKGLSFSGRVLMPDGRTPVAAGKRALDVRLNSLSSRWVLRAESQPDGSFVFPHVPPGKYTLTGESNSNVHPGDFQGSHEVDLESGDVRGFEMKMAVVEPLEVSGVIVMEDGSKAEPAIVTLRSGFGREYSAETADEGSFVIKGVLPELQHFVRIKRLARPGEPDSMTSVRFPVSVLWNGRETSRSFGFEISAGSGHELKITLARLNASVKGRVLGAGAGAQVLLIPASATDAPLDFEGLPPAFTDANGAFQTNRRPGSYRVLVTRNNNWTDYQYLMQHEKAWGPVQLGPGENPAITLELPDDSTAKSPPLR